MTIHPLACWAKLSRSKEQTGYHPLLYRLIDIAVVTETLWNEVLPAAARQRVADNLGVDCYPHARGGEPPIPLMSPATSINAASPATRRCVLSIPNPSSTNAFGAGPDSGAADCRTKHTRAASR